MRDKRSIQGGVLLGAALLAIVGGVVGITSCGTAPSPFLVSGPGRTGNDVPTLDIREPIENITTGQGDPFRIRWTDTDRDNNAAISFALVNLASNVPLLLVSGISENDLVGPDSFTVSTTLISPGAYNLLGTIDDGVNPPVTSFALVADAATQQRVVVRIVPPGEGQQTVPPVVAVTDPQINLSVTQDDVLTIAIQPTLAAPAQAQPFDPDSTATLFILLDVDTDPTNDQPANPDPSQIIVLAQQEIPLGVFQIPPVDIVIDLDQIPALPGGNPYHIRATITDSTNTPVHSYAPGTISIVQLAAGEVDLFEIGRTKSGAKFQGFSPKANLGSTIANVGDFDGDLVDDFVMVAQFGNPQNAGSVGEAYLVYGQGRVPDGGTIPLAGNRFGGTISVNSISGRVSGVVFQAPPLRTSQIPRNDARTDGITDVSTLRDVTGDGRPELLFGLPHVHGAFDSMDYDPEDGTVDPAQGSPFLCYPDSLVNNITDSSPLGVDLDFQWFAGGIAVTVNSTNRDNDGPINVLRLDNTTISLELVGQGTEFPLDAAGTNASGDIVPRADNDLPSVNTGTDPQEGGRIAGSRLVAGGYDFLFQTPPREGLFGQTFRSMGDLTSDGVDELVISAPTNERYLADLLSDASTLTFRQDTSTRFRGSITVVPGNNYNQTPWRDSGDASGTSTIPFILGGNCTGMPMRRGNFIPAEAFDIFAEDIDDFLGQGQSAGDVNQDGLDDILCGAPLNDRSAAAQDTGATYIIFGRPTFGEVLLTNADNSSLRPPMLRIRGEKVGDQIGWRETAGLDVNGDRIDDVFLGSPRTDWGPVNRATCGSDFDGDLVFNANDLRVSQFNTCRSSTNELFSDDACKAFDYDNDNDVDDDDRCVFCCLSGECDPDDTCVFGTGASCCDNLVDNGFVAVVFGGVFTDGDRTLAQIATPQLPGVVFHGNAAGDRAGFDISSAGDFNQDGFGDILIAAPGEVRTDSSGRERLGVVYLVFGGPQLVNKTFNLKSVGSAELPGIVFLSPFVKGRPNEAAPTTVAFIGDINRDGFGDIAIGNPLADFIDPSFPQGPNAPGTNPATGRRSNVGDAYIIYGNNFGNNRAVR